MAVPGSQVRTMGLRDVTEDTQNGDVSIIDALMLCCSYHTPHMAVQHPFLPCPPIVHT